MINQKSGWTTITLLLICLFQLANAQVVHPVKEVSSVTFKINNFGIGVKGRFTDIKGDILYHSENLNEAKFSISIGVTSVNTDNSTRDNHLKKSTYFDVAQFPEIRFISTTVEKTNIEHQVIITGNLFIKGKTSSIKVPVSVSTRNNLQFFAGSFTINRLDFDVGEKSMVLSDNVLVTIQLQVK